MSVLESVLVALFIITVVFVVLCALFIIMSIFSKVLESITSSKSKQSAMPGKA